MFIYQRVTLDKPMEKSHSGRYLLEMSRKNPADPTGRLWAVGLVQRKARLENQWCVRARNRRILGVDMSFITISYYKKVQNKI